MDISGSVDISEFCQSINNKDNHKIDIPSKFTLLFAASTSRRDLLIQIVFQFLQLPLQFLLVASDLLICRAIPFGLFSSSSPAAMAELLRLVQLVLVESGLLHMLLKVSQLRFDHVQ